MSNYQIGDKFKPVVGIGATSDNVLELIDIHHDKGGRFRVILSDRMENVGKEWCKSFSTVEKLHDDPAQAELQRRLTLLETQTLTLVKEIRSALDEFLKGKQS